MLGIAMIAWMRARLDAEPERYESFAWRVDWAQKWVPSSAIDYPSVPLDQIRAQIDDLERRHRASGAGPRQARRSADPRPPRRRPRHPRAHYQAWQASERTSLSDCAACEMRLPRPGRCARSATMPGRWRRSSR
ncbi:MAG: hypothetical protein U0P45_13025 [Acidimicrobiales bacterium]